MPSRPDAWISACWKVQVNGLRRVRHKENVYVDKCIVLWETGNECLSQKKGGHESSLVDGISNI